ncbi:MAG: hypothetical protein JWP16_773, partial [Alphaproteobacteria bacterium]|nr:hypothetical protein [Alphaproteobacteria bacterium]
LTRDGATIALVSRPGAIATVSSR